MHPAYMGDIMKKRIIIILTVITCMLSVIYIRQKELLDKYRVRDCVVSMDESISYKGYDISISSAELWDYNAFYNSIDNPTEDVVYKAKQDTIEGLDAIILVCEMSFTRVSDVEGVDTIDTTNFYVLQDGYYKVSDWQLFNLINQSSYDIDLNVGETATYKMFFTMYEGMVSDEDWKKRGTLDYMIQLEMYPERTGFYLEELVDKTSNEPVELMLTVKEDSDEDKLDEEDIRWDYGDYIENKTGGVHKLTELPPIENIVYSDIVIEHTDDIKALLERDDYSEEYFFGHEQFDLNTGEIKQLESDIERGRKTSYYYMSYTMENVSDEPMIISLSNINIVMRLPDYWVFYGTETSYRYYTGEPSELTPSQMIIMPGEKEQVFTLQWITFDDSAPEHIDEAYMCFNPTGTTCSLNNELQTYGIIEGGLDR